MKCINCNQELNENDAVCSNCGFIQYAQGPKLDNNGNLVNNTNNNNSTNNNQSTNKHKFKFQIVPFIFLLVIVIALFVVRKTFNHNKINYAGYEITLLDGYKAEEKDKKLYIKKDYIEYVVMVDYTYSYDQYISNIKKTFPKTAETCKVTLENKEYCSLASNGYMIYYTSADSSSTFIGWATKDNDSMYGKDDIKDLSKILSTAKLKQKDTSYDVGNNEYLSFSDIKDS